MTSNASTLSSDQIPPLPPLKLPSTFFTGRDIYLQTLKDCFSPDTDSERKKFLLYGMGGIGKTQICLKFIAQYGKTWFELLFLFSDIFWIDASSEHTIDLCLRQIAKKHKVDSTPSAEAALEWISHRKNWLMVFDNADGGYHVVEKFIPPGSEGSILITSRDKGLARISSGTHCIEVTEMGEEEAIALLLKSAKVHNNSVNVAIAAQRLVATLGYIPLAIDQGGAYVQTCDCGLDYYLELFIKHHARLMSDEEFRGASLYNKSTYGTWEISIEEIKHRAGGENNAQRLAAQNALYLHEIFAFLHHDNISEDIFKNAALNFMRRKGEITDGLPQFISLLDCKGLFLDDDGNWDAFQFQAGIKVLLSFSLIRGNGKLYSVHPLMHTWSRDRISVGNVSDCCRKSRALLACSFDYQEDDYKFYALLAPHIKANGEYAQAVVT
ncbi:P-loop containing nucleoside triphosphate hydrolase protein [Amanita muscaria]